MVRDFRYALRQLRATPVFTVFAIVTLALGIGTTTGIYAAVRAVLSPPSGIADVDRLVNIARLQGGSVPMMALAWPEYQDFAKRQTSFDGIAAWTFFNASHAANGRADNGVGEAVSGDYFKTLGVTPQLGRLLQPDDDRTDAAPAAVISDITWRHAFDASPDAIGQPIKIDGSPFTIVGVASPEFTGLFNGGLIATNVWITLNGARTLPATGTGRDYSIDSRSHWILMTAHVAGGRTVEEARADAVAIGRSLDMIAAREAGEPTSRTEPPWSVESVAAVPKIMGGGRLVGPFAATLMGAVGLVLLVACTNLANLMLARSASRRRDAAVRLSLGASRVRLLLENLVEIVLLAAAGGFGGLVIARALATFLATPLVVTRGAAIQLHPVLDWPVFAAALAATVFALAIAGVGPAWHAASVDTRPVTGSEGQSTSSSRWRGRRYLIAAQVAVSVLLVAIAGLCVSQIHQMSTRDVGMDPSHLALLEINFTQQHVDEPRARAIVDAVLEQVARQPDMTAVAVSSGLPAGISSPGGTARGDGSALSATYLAATPSVFRTLGVSIVRGEPITDRDRANTTPVAVIGDQTALKIFGTTDVIGRPLTVQRARWAGEAEPLPETRTIVGVAHEAPPGGSPALRRAIVYIPFAQHFEGDLVLSARTSGDAGRAINILQQALRTIAPDTAVVQALTGESLMAQDVLFYQVVGAITSILGTMAVVVALAGLYGILSFVVAGRTREIGIRMAIGADASRIRRQVLREGLVPVWLGLVLGLGAGALARLGLQPMFVRLVPAFDPMLLLAVPALFVGAGLIACYLPSIRASRVDPVVALRQL